MTGEQFDKMLAEMDANTKELRKAMNEIIAERDSLILENIRLRNENYCNANAVLIESLFKK